MMVPRITATITTTITNTTAAAAAAGGPAEPMASAGFDPRNQTFYIAGPDGKPTIAIAMSTIEAQRVRLANVAINYGCQLGLTLMTLIVILLLLPTARLRRLLHAVQVSALIVAVARLCLLVLYFPGPLAGFYVSWTHDARPLDPADYAANTTSNALGVVQLALVETALVLQARAMMRTWTWGSSSSGSSRSWSRPWSGSGSGAARWCRAALLALSVVLAGATVAMRGVWVAQHTRLLRGPRFPTLPLPLTRAGEAAVALGAASIFFFCGLFFAHLSLHLVATRGLLARPGGRALTSLEILAIGNGVLMLAPSLFAGLDIAAGLGNNRVLPFDAGSWVQTLTVTGLPLISLVAYHRGVNLRSSSRAVSLFAAAHPPDDGRGNGEIEGGSGGVGSAGGRSWNRDVEGGSGSVGTGGSNNRPGARRTRSRWDYEVTAQPSAPPLSSLRQSGAGRLEAGAMHEDELEDELEDEKESGDTDDTVTVVGGSSSVGGSGGQRGSRGYNSNYDYNSSTSNTIPKTRDGSGGNSDRTQRSYHRYNTDREEKSGQGDAAGIKGTGTTETETETGTEGSYESVSEKQRDEDEVRRQ